MLFRCNRVLRIVRVLYIPGKMRTTHVIPLGKEIERKITPTLITVEEENLMTCILPSISSFLSLSNNLESYI